MKSSNNTGSQTADPGPHAGQKGDQIAQSSLSKELLAEFFSTAAPDNGDELVSDRVWEAASKLPPAFDLAQLAATLMKGSDHETALREALTLSIKAEILTARWKQVPLCELVFELGDEALIEQSVGFLQRKGRLRFEPALKKDQLRQFLGRNGLNLSKGRSARANLVAFFEAKARLQEGGESQLARRKAEERLQEMKVSSNGQPDLFMIPQAIAQSLIRWKKKVKRDGGAKSVVTTKMKISKVH